MDNDKTRKMHFHFCFPRGMDDLRASTTAPSESASAHVYDMKVWRFSDDPHKVRIRN